MNPYKILPNKAIDYIVCGKPTASVNPKKPFVTWLNTLTGELFVCLSNATDDNGWVGQKGSSVCPPSLLSASYPLTIVNPNATDGTTGWTDETGSLMTRTTSGAPSGGRYFYSRDSTTISRQTIALDFDKYAQGMIEDHGMKIAVTYWYGGYSGDNDCSQVGIRFRNAAQVVIGSTTYSPTYETDSGWHQTSAYEVSIPVDACYVDIIQKKTRHGGTDNNGYQDDFEANILLDS